MEHTRQDFYEFQVKFTPVHAHYKTAEEKTRCWWCWTPWSSFKDRMMTWRDFTKKDAKWRNECLIACMCVFDRERCVCVYCFVPSKWIGVYSCLLYCCSHEKKSIVQEDQKCLQIHGKETFISTRGIVKLVRAVHCSSWQKIISFLICTTSFVRSIVGTFLLPVSL